MILEGPEYFQRLISDMQEKIIRQQNILADNPLRDADGKFTRSLSGSFATVGTAKYLLDHNLQAFKDAHTKSGQLTLSLFVRAAAGEDIESSFLTLGCFSNIFEILAAGDIELAKKLADAILQVDKAYNKEIHKFSITFGNALANLILSSDDTQLWLEKLTQLCTRYKNFSGYPKMMIGISEGNIELINSGVEQIIEGHIRDVKRSAVYSDLDKYICLWGLGLINFARHLGFQVGSNHELIPRDLLI